MLSLKSHELSGLIGVALDLLESACPVLPKTSFGQGIVTTFVGGFVTWLFLRRKQNAEITKLNAEAAKLNSELQKVNAETAKLESDLKKSSIELDRLKIDLKKADSDAKKASAEVTAARMNELSQLQRCSAEHDSTHKVLIEKVRELAEAAIEAASTLNLDKYKRIRAEVVGILCSDVVRTLSDYLDYFELIKPDDCATFADNFCVASLREILSVKNNINILINKDIPHFKMRSSSFLHIKIFVTKYGQATSLSQFNRLIDELER